MTVGDGKPITAAAEAAATAKTAPALADRFAGGREYRAQFNTTAFNSTQSPAQVVSAEFAKVLEAAKIDNPTHAVRDRLPTPAPTQAAAPTGGATTLVLRTDLEPEIAKTQLAELKESLANNPDLLFERITNFGGTVAGETRTLALVATVASWLIIIAYLWLRFQSFTYGLAAVLAVVHDVLDHPGRGRRQLLAGDDPRS